MENSEKSTPMMSQYMRIKKENRGALLLFHLGDFYEMFFEDALAASRILHITLTSRGSQGKKIPMAGIPCHAADNYIARLVKAGLRVAICEQVEDAKEARGLLRREVVRTITPGTILESGLLEAGANNYIAAVNKNGNKYAIAFADISTGEFRITEVDSEEEFTSELSRLNPGECLYPDDPGKNMAGVLEQTGITLTATEPWKYSAESASRELAEHFRLGNLEGLGAGEFPGAVGCAGALLAYLNETQKTSLGHINRLGVYHTNDFMVLDRSSRRNLELTRNLQDGSSRGTLIEVMDETRTSMGARLLRQWLLQPLLEAEKIKKRQESVSEFAENAPRRRKLRSLLAGISDLERLIGRISCGRAGARDLAALRDSLEAMQPLGEELSGCGTSLAREAADNLPGYESILKLLRESMVDSPPAALKEGGIIKDGFNPELDELRSLRKDGRKWIAELEAREIKRTGINSLKVGYNKVFGYFIEVTKSNLSGVPQDYERKQTLVGSERFITPELKEHETRVFRASERSEELEYEIFCRIRDKAAEEVKTIQRIAHSIATLDVLANFAEIAVNRGYKKPAVDEGDRLVITEGRHPVMEKTIGGNNFVANDTLLDRGGNRIIIITGPNMAGKSTYIRQVALLVIMAQCGSFIPAARASISVVDRIFTRVGASDDLSGGRSTFMVEMNETANILNNATPKSLIILDEIGRGTSTYDGVSIAWAVVEYLHDHPGVSAKTLFATHYHELISLSGELDSVKNFCVLVREWNGRIIFLRKVVPGGTDRSYGIHVARLAGLPEEVITRAGQILKSLEDGTAPRFRETAPSKKDPQMPLFPDKPRGPGEEIAGELAALEPDSMSPLEALNKLVELKKKIEENDG